MTDVATIDELSPLDTAVEALDDVRPETVAALLDASGAEAAVTAGADDAPDVPVEATDGQYAHVAVRGVIGGWVACALIFFVIARLGLPDAGWGWWLGASIGAAMWVGPFFGLVVANGAFQLRLEEQERQRLARRSRAAVAAAVAASNVDLVA